MLDDLVAALQPRWCKVSADFAVRGGIGITVDAEFGSERITRSVLRGKRANTE
jgi:NADPH-dependent 7-cyano-7-deazaguanine reductase QueF